MGLFIKTAFEIKARFKSHQSEHRRGLIFAFMLLLHRDLLQRVGFFLRAQKHSVIFGEVSRQREREKERGWDEIRNRTTILLLSCGSYINRHSH